MMGVHRVREVGSKKKKEEAVMMRRWSLLSKTTKSNTLFIPINLISDSGKVGRAENIHTIVLHAMSSLSWASEIHASSTLVVQRSP